MGARLLHRWSENLQMGKEKTSMTQVAVDESWRCQYALMFSFI